MITSAKTSVHQIPALFKWMYRNGVFDRQDGGSPCVNLDLGAGKYDAGTEYLEGLGVVNLPWDRYNRTPEHNAKVAKMTEDLEVTSVTIANVLNVIPYVGDRKYLLYAASSFRVPIYIAVYEGDRSGISHFTTKGWQEHRKTADYVKEIEDTGFFSKVERKGKVIIAIPARAGLEKGRKANARLLRT